MSSNEGEAEDAEKNDENQVEGKSQLGGDEEQNNNGDGQTEITEQKESKQDEQPDNQEGNEINEGSEGEKQKEDENSLNQNAEEEDDNTQGSKKDIVRTGGGYKKKSQALNDKQENEIEEADDPEEIEKIQQIFDKLNKLEDSYTSLAVKWASDKNEVKHELEIEQLCQKVEKIIPQIKEASVNSHGQYESLDIKILKEEGLAKAMLKDYRSDHAQTVNLSQQKEMQDIIKDLEQTVKLLQEQNDSLKINLDKQVNLNTLRSQLSNGTNQFKNFSQMNSASTTLNNNANKQIWVPQKELNSEDFQHFIPQKPRLEPIKRQGAKTAEIPRKVFLVSPPSFTREIYKTAIANKQMFMQSIPEENPGKLNKPGTGFKSLRKSSATLSSKKQIKSSDGRNYVIKTSQSHDRNIFVNHITPQTNSPDPQKYQRVGGLSSPAATNTNNYFN